MAGGGVGEAALIEAVIASEAAGVAAGGSLLGTALPAGGIAGLLGAGEAAGLASGAGGLANLTPLLEGEFGTAALNPAVAAQTAQAANVAGQAPMLPNEVQLAQAETAQNAGRVSQFSPAGQGSEFNTLNNAETAQLTQNMDPRMTNSFMPQNVTPGEPDPTKNPYPEFTSKGAAPAVPAAPGAEAFTGRTMTGLPTVPGEGVTEPGFFGQIGKAYGELPPMLKYGLGAMGAVKALNAMDGNKYGTPEKEKYEGPLSKFKYDPSRYSPLVPQPRRMAGGGLSDLGSYADYAGGGRMLKGPGDGMSDNIPATIAGKQPARLANEEFVVPADVVSHLGNGSSDAGAKQLYKMMDKVRAARTGKKSQAKQINPTKYMPA